MLSARSAMSTSRLGRVTKGRVFVYIVFGLLLVALVACYKNASALLEEAQKGYETCRQDHENISQQYRVVLEYKQRLEKSLQNEKNEHLHAKTDYTNKLNDEKQKCVKIGNDAKQRFTSLQQHYNLLQTQHDDFKEECSKIQREQLDRINELQTKLKDAQDEVQKMTKNTLQLEQEAANMKLQLTQKNTANKVERTEYSSTQFNKVIRAPDGHYVIPLNNDKEKDAIEADAVLQTPYQVNANSPKTMTKTSPKLPIPAPAATPDTASKASTKKLILPMPYQNLPDGVVPAPNLSDPDGGDKAESAANEENADGKFRNVGEKPDEAGGKKTNELKNQFDMDNENGANEVFDNDVKAAKIKDGKKARIDDLNAGNNEVDYENHDELEEGDDAADGANPANHEAAVRN